MILCGTKDLSERTKQIRVYLFLILLIAAGLRLWGLDWGLPYEYQSEEYKVVKYALRMGGGDLNPHFFEYPSLYLYFMLFLFGLYYLFGSWIGLFSGTHEFALSFIKDPTPFYLIGRVSEAICGAAIVYLVYKIGKRLFSENVGLCSALIFAALPNFVYLSHIIKGPMGMTLLLLIFFWHCISIAEKESPRSYIMAGILLGLATSTRYHAAPFGIVLPLVHFYRLYLASDTQERKEKSFWDQHKLFLLALILIPIFFILTTPYSVLTPKEFWKDLGSNISVYYINEKEATYLTRIGIVLWRFLHLGDIPASLLLGGLCGLGFLYSMVRWEKKHLLTVVPIVTYFLIVSGYENPAAGYLLHVLPLFVIWGIHGLFTFSKEMSPGFWQGKTLKPAVILGLSVAIVWNFWEGSALAYSFTLPDTRTLAKNWIEKNIPQGSHILIDMKTYSPPLLMSYEQAERFSNRAADLNHYKKEYLKLQLETHPGKGNGYKIYTVLRGFQEIGSLPHQVEEVQKMQDLVQVNEDISKLKEMGIQYVIVSEDVEKGAIRNNLPGLADFYRNLPSKAVLIQSFAPKFRVTHCGRISIYRL